MKLLKSIFAIATVCVIGVVVGAGFNGLSPLDLYRIVETVIRQRINRETVDSRMIEIEHRHPELVDIANAIGEELRIVVFKRERRVELHARGWKKPMIYAMHGFSGSLGPKLKDGDGQIPEGVYGVKYLNPNSLFYLSLKVSYPNDFDRARASEDGRSCLGGDIMIHGGSATIGCVPIGDDGIEEVFYFAGKVGCGKITVVIAPYDMRRGRVPELEISSVAWYPKLCAIIYEELLKLKPCPNS